MNHVKPRKAAKKSNDILSRILNEGRRELPDSGAHRTEAESRPARALISSTVH